MVSTRRAAGQIEHHLIWRHDEFLYQVVKDYLPEEVLYMIRYHSSYAAHRESAYAHLMSEHHKRMFAAVPDLKPV